MRRTCATYYITGLFRQSSWIDAGQGGEGQNGELALTSWCSKRRVVVLRRTIKGEMVLAGQDDDGQQVLAFVEADRKAGKGITGYEYAVLIINSINNFLRDFFLAAKRIVRGGTGVNPKRSLSHFCLSAHQSATSTRLLDLHRMAQIAMIMISDCTYFTVRPFRVSGRSEKASVSVIILPP